MSAKDTFSQLAADQLADPQPIVEYANEHVKNEATQATYDTGNSIWYNIDWYDAGESSLDRQVMNPGLTQHQPYPPSDQWGTSLDPPPPYNHQEEQSRTKDTFHESPSLSLLAQPPQPDESRDLRDEMQYRHHYLTAAEIDVETFALPDLDSLANGYEMPGAILAHSEPDWNEPVYRSRRSSLQILDKCSAEFYGETGEAFNIDPRLLPDNAFGHSTIGARDVPRESSMSSLGQGPTEMTASGFQEPPGHIQVTQQSAATGVYARPADGPQDFTQPPGIALGIPPSSSRKGEQKLEPKRKAKRKATMTPSAFELTPKRRKAKKAREDEEVSTQMEAKQKIKKYAALAGVEDAPLPDYSHIKLESATREESANAFKTRLASLETHWTPPSPDTSIPVTNADRQAAVRIIFGAMKDTSNASDADSKAFHSRWGADALRKYDDVDMLETSWHVVDLAEQLHREGPSILSVRDPHYLAQIKSSGHLTFIQRIRVIASLLIEWKARCDGMIKGDRLHTTVGAPLEALQSA